MRVGGGLNYVTGPMGSGKSLYGVRRIVEAVAMERYAVTNVQLGHWEGGYFIPGDGWARLVARHFAWWRTRRARVRIADKLLGYYVYETELADAMRYRLPRGHGEARGVFLWDETHNDLNNRNWRDEGRQAILEWATQLRKLGYVGFLLSQHHENTDAALRRVCNYLIRLQNQREQTRLLGLRVTPWPLFLAPWYPTNVPLDSRTKAMRVERYFLSWHRRLYDTFDLYHGLASDADGGDVVQLPAGGLRGASPEGGSPAPAPVETFPWLDARVLDASTAREPGS